MCERYRSKRPATLDGPVWEFLHCIALPYDLNELVYQVIILNMHTTINVYNKHVVRLDCV